MSFDRLLFNPVVSRAFSTIYNPESMVGIALRDGIEQSGRIYQEWERDPDGGRERAIEEATTTLVWGFGISSLKSTFDKAAGFVSKVAPGLNSIKLGGMDLFKIGTEHNTNTLPVPNALKGRFQKILSDGVSETQRLTPELVKRFAHDSEKSALLDAIAHPVKYEIGGLARFLFATTTPVLFLGFGLPKLNQWLTRKIVSERHAENELNAMKEAGQMQPKASMMPQPQNKQPEQGMPVMQDATQAVSTMPVNTGTLHGVPSQTAFAQRLGVEEKPFERLSPYFQQVALQAKTPKFGNNFATMAALVNRAVVSDKWATAMTIDAPLSSGRVYSARNWIERMEIAFREAGIIYFLFFAQKKIQEHVEGFLGKHVLHDIPFFHIQELSGLKNQFFNDPKQFSAKLAESMKQLNLPETLPEMATFEKDMVPKVLEHFANPNRASNLILDLATESHIVPVIRQFEGPMAAFKKVNPVLGNRLSQSIKTGDLYSLIERLQKLDQFGVKQGDNAFKGLIRNQYMGKAGAWFAGAAVSFAMLSFVMPKIQHFITKFITGYNEFPGTESSFGSLSDIKEALKYRFETLDTIKPIDYVKAQKQKAQQKALPNLAQTSFSAPTQAQLMLSV